MGICGHLKLMWSGMQRRALSTDEKEAVADSTSIHELAALLQLYGTALRLHAACAAMQPQVLPLLGQAIIMVSSPILRHRSLCFLPDPSCAMSPCGVLQLLELLRCLQDVSLPAMLGSLMLLERACG